MSDNPARAPTTDFGFRRVAVAAKRGLVRQVFDSVAPRYDLMNDLMSLGIHRAWKRILLTELGPRPSRRLLDLASGTGDIGLGWRSAGGGPALLSDVNPAMLSIARDRAIGRGLIARTGPGGHRRRKSSIRRRACSIGSRSASVCATAPTSQRCWPRHAVSCVRVVGSFAWNSAVRRSPCSTRFMRPGCSGCCPGWAPWWLTMQTVTATWRRASAPFPTRRRLAAMMIAAGFDRVQVRNLSGGIVAIHSGWRL